ncbi:MAG TPA: hypothetical protein VFC93_02250 [Chloroflexota bacterium]|nr:hypothetical protein [Chloroflexota bacterium]
MPPRTAKQAIRRWFKEHPKTFCPVVGQAVCKHGGCDNAQLRADARCNIGLKTAMYERAHALPEDGRPWLADVRLSADRRRYVLNFPFDRMFLQDFKSVIPPSDRSYDAATREWSVDRRHWAMLNTLFTNFADWDAELSRLRRAQASERPLTQPETGRKVLPAAPTTASR